VNQPEAALTAFETTLKKEPNRYRALAGAVEAERRLQKSGQGTGPLKQPAHSAALLDLAAKADGPVRPEIAALKAGAR
jgi:hypothetical protein